MKNVRVKQSLCDICELVVNFIKPYVDNNSTEEEVKQAVDQLCSILPSAISSEVCFEFDLILSQRLVGLSYSYITCFILQCTQLVDQNFDAIWKLFESEFVSPFVCQLLKILF